MKKFEKIKRITNRTLVIGVDIGKNTHYVRCIDFRGVELGKYIKVKNNYSEYEDLEQYIQSLKKEYDKDDVIIGCEPTGHYWLNLFEYFKDIYDVVMVNPYHVKRSKELDDNNPTKNDKKDAYVIARLVSHGRFAKPVVKEGIYAEIAAGKKILDDMTKEKSKLKNQMINWSDRYFPELQKIYKKFNSQEVFHILKYGLHPEMINNMTSEQILSILREGNRNCSIKKAIRIKETSKTSIGIKINTFSHKEITRIMKRYFELLVEEQELLDNLEEQLEDIEYAKSLIEIKGVGSKQIITIIAECGDINNYDHYKQLVKLAGLSLKENSSGIKKGKHRISKRGRPGLRKILRSIAITLVRSNEAFRQLHKYYTTKRDTKLTKRVSLNAIANKFIRIMFRIIKTNTKFDMTKMISESLLLS